MKIEEMSLSQIEEYLKEITDNETNLYMRCLDCEEYKPIYEFNVETEICKECEEI